MLEWGEPHTKAPYWPPIDLVCELTDWAEMIRYIDNSTGICSGLSGFHYKPPFHIHNFPLFISYATGIDIELTMTTPAESPEPFHPDREEPRRPHPRRPGQWANRGAVRRARLCCECRR